MASSPPLTGTRACASLALPAHGRRRRCSAGGGGAGASPGVFLGTARPWAARRARQARPGPLEGLLTRSGPRRGDPRPCSVQAVALLAQALFSCCRGLEPERGRRTGSSWGALAAPIAALSPALPNPEALGRFCGRVCATPWPRGAPSGRPPPETMAPRGTRADQQCLAAMAQPSAAVRAAIFVSRQPSE